MRPDNDFRKDYVIKKEILARLRHRYDIVQAWDDNPAILKLWGDEGIPTIVVPGWDDPPTPAATSPYSTNAATSQETP